MQTLNKKSFSIRLLPWMVIGVLAIGESLPSLLQAEDPPVLMAQKELEQKVTDLLRVNAQESQEPELLLQLSALYLDLGYGVYVEPSQKLATFKEGARLAKKAMEIREASAKAHFLYAANLGSAAEIEGLVSAVTVIQELKRHVKRALELDGHYAPAHHMLGRMYEELPWFLGGDQQAAGEHFKRAVDLDLKYAPARLDFARWLVRHGREEEAKKELQLVIQRPPLEKKWIWEKRHKPEAVVLLRQLSGGKESAP